MTTAVASPPAETSALRVAGYRTFLITFMLAMMADNIEHVISYWVAFQKFHSAALGGFAVVSHWLPFLMFSVPVGALNDRFDSRRLIQVGMVLFISASVGWGYFFVTDSLQMWHAMVLLTLHGCAGVLWGTSSQMLLYDIVGPGYLASAVRLNATARYLGVLVGPGVGSIIMRTLGPTRGIFVNTMFYLPLLLWLVAAPYGRHFRGGVAGAKRAVRGLADIVQTLRDVRGMPVVSAMVLLAGAASFFIGNSYQAQMPGFAHDLGHGDPGMAYTLLLGADAAGALLAGILLETRGTWLPMTAPSALKIALLWGCSLFLFSFMRWYPAAICVLFVAGFLELSFSSMTQALVQLNAPDTIRGRVLGLFSMSASGLRAFSGVTVGLLGSVTNTHLSLALSAVAFVAVAGLLLLRRPQQAAA
ncbi:MFS transporter [Pyxidicoccus parkwayensis]|uniref:MFS transporter n=1 Tax=Pyxidicoccus parkwayensis TaxID=2813578 RepID=A0ABX7NL51_9BACT|nr:MFS transporter [Pyxidicoccus parkwaysis]QSQ19104.1 MFS transporter [Pyxidicoccus parkwaysis]